VNRSAPQTLSDQGIADPTTEAFWQACRDRRILVQRCDDCGHHQFYPRPLCLACESTHVGWAEAKGQGTVYSATIVRVPVTDELPPPYALAIIQLDEGPRLLTNIEGLDAKIGDRVDVAWRTREPLPPLPVFRLSRR
jgi:uncharacterized protein